MTNPKNPENVPYKIEGNKISIRQSYRAEEIVAVEGKPEIVEKKLIEFRSDYEAVKPLETVMVEAIKEAMKLQAP